MKLQEVIQIAQSHLDNEETSLTEVIEAFQTFIEKETFPKENCFVSLSVSEIWGISEETGLIVTDEEAEQFLDYFGNYYNKFSGNTIGNIIESMFEEKFSDAPKGSWFEEKIKQNDIEKIKFMVSNYYVFQHIGEGAEVLLSQLLECAVENNRVEIAEILLEADAPITKEVMDKAKTSEIKELLGKVK